ncbi:MAG TPA: radical SAM protein [Rhizomicrobium sp.]|nr:radical SAM protein [Rhizomicrobium sp.]
MNGLQYAYLLPTGRCNLSCPGCYATLEIAGRHSARGELSADALERVVDELLELGVRIFDISGGEPLLYRGLAAICRRIKRQPGAAIWLVTNGALRRHPLRLAPLAGLIDRLLFSIDSAIPEQHDEMRGMAGAFDATLATLRSMDRTQFPVVGINQLLTRQNAAQIALALELAAREKLDRLHVLWPRDVSESGSLLDLLPRWSEMRAVWTVVADWLSSHDLPDAVDIVAPAFLLPEANAFRRNLPVALQKRLSFSFPQLRGLGPFRHSMVVKPYGTLTGDTAFANFPLFECAREGSVRESWEAQSVAWQDRLARRQSELRDTECAGCPRWSACRGGCPAAAFNQSGDWRHRDHSCDIYRSDGLF